ncbi:hypothetical protein V8E55_002535 [Tylopilus felleus]
MDSRSRGRSTRCVDRRRLVTADGPPLQATAMARVDDAARSDALEQCVRASMAVTGGRRNHGAEASRIPLDYKPVGTSRLQCQCCCVRWTVMMDGTNMGSFDLAVPFLAYSQHEMDEPWRDAIHGRWSIVDDRGSTTRRQTIADGCHTCLGASPQSPTPRISLSSHNSNTGLGVQTRDRLSRIHTYLSHRLELMHESLLRFACRVYSGA